MGGLADDTGTVLAQMRCSGNDREEEEDLYLGGAEMSCLPWSLLSLSVNSGLPCLPSARTIHHVHEGRRHFRRCRPYYLQILNGFTVTLT